MKKIICTLLTAVLVLANMSFAAAANVTEITWDNEDQGSKKSEKKKDMSKPYLALGQDLTSQQLATVLSLMGLAGNDISGYNVVYVTNAEEHQYLDNYISPSVIGTKALSSVLVQPREKGHGIKVETKNINYCTEGMYINALATAGVTDADIIVAAPSSISGTSALIGALKAYAEMTDTKVNEKALDTSLDELVTTGELESALSSADSDDVEAMVAFVKAQIAKRDLNSREDIEKAVRKAIDEYNAEKGTNITLTEEQIRRIVDVMIKIKALGLDYDTLLDQAGEIYKSMGGDFSKLTEDDIAGAIEKNKWKVAGAVVKSYVTNVVNKVGDFIGGLFGKK
ncbi:MAG: DUF1002 domain-containing protein [Lachnospiraceae bacterium]|nr:DUF1002 domain-containing protein [Lachnospiraceae bacterium]